jgi:hypothetical protein
MRVITIGFNQGSLLRRTLLHVASFVLGAFAVISLLSFVCVSVAKGLLPAHVEATTRDDGPGVVVDKPGAATKGVRMKPRAAGVGAAIPRATGKDG